MRTIFMGILGFIVCSFGTAFVVFFGYVLIAVVTNYNDFEGATAMGMVTIGFVAGIIGGVVGAVIFARLSYRKRTV